MFSSVELLWLPGVLLNWLFYSKTVLSMTRVGLVPRLLSLVILWLAFRWINRYYPPTNLEAPHPPAGLEAAGGPDPTCGGHLHSRWRRSGCWRHWRVLWT